MKIETPSRQAEIADFDPREFGLTSRHNASAKYEAIYRKAAERTLAAVDAGRGFELEQMLLRGIDGDGRD